MLYDIFHISWCTLYIESNHRIYILNQIINIHYMQKAQNKKIKGILLKSFEYAQA